MPFWLYLFLLLHLLNSAHWLTDWLTLCKHSGSQSTLCTWTDIALKVTLKNRMWHRNKTYFSDSKWDHTKQFHCLCSQDGPSSGSNRSAPTVDHTEQENWKFSTAVMAEEDNVSVAAGLSCGADGICKSRQTYEGKYRAQTWVRRTQEPSEAAILGRKLPQVKT